MRRVIVLRPEPGATSTGRRARELGLEAVAVPLFEVEAVAWQAPDPSRFDSLLLTSANAVRLGGEELTKLRDLPVHAVGEATAEAAREAGFEVASSGTSGVDALLKSITPGTNVLHLCGEDRIASADSSDGITRIVVYRAREIATPDLGQAQDSIALVHSPRAGRRFRELIDQAGMNRGSIAIAAISPAAAGAVGDGWERVEAAESPSDDALLALAARLCNKPPRP
jgi:uroporphyrinogen-III synthase